MVSNFFEATPEEFFYVDQTKFEQDNGFEKTRIVDRCAAAISRAVGKDSGTYFDTQGNRLGYEADGRGRETFHNLPAEFEPGYVLEVIVRIYKPDPAGA